MPTACVRCRDGAAGAAAPRWKNAGQPWSSGSTASLQSCMATVCSGEPVFGAVGCLGSRAGEGWEEAEMLSSAFRYIFAP